jgi:choline dehydrogenase-like flavoprotein
MTPWLKNRGLSDRIHPHFSLWTVAILRVILGRQGPFPIRQRSMDSITPSLRAFVEAGSALGFKYIDDFNAAEQHGIGPYPLDVIDGVRQNSGITYLTEEVRRRPNLTIRHATSTAPMGGDQDASAVVDWLGAVRGVEGLRVIDASIFPEIPSTPIKPTVIMAAEHIAARLISRNLI